MPTNDQIILGQLLDERKREIAPELTESQFFEVFAAEQALKDYDISNDEIDEGIVGDGGDGGIDSIHVFINGELLHEDTDLGTYKGEISMSVHVVQAKRTTGFSEDAIHKFRATAEDLFDLSKKLSSMAKVYNQKLLATVEKYREAHTRFAAKLPKLSFHYYYATSATEVHPNVERQVPALKECIRKLFSSADFTFDFLSAKGLLDLARTSVSKVYTLPLAETPISSTKSFICLINLSDYFAFIRDDNGRIRRSLFDANVRDYQGDIEVNKGIRGSLENPKDEDFWWLNNGITIIAEEATHSGKTLTIRNPQIVNGLQTSQEVFHVMSAIVKPDPRNLLVRVLVPDQSSSYQRIVRATNSQTSVSPASLRATDPFHRDIEDYLKANKVYYERRKNYYKNESRPRDAIVSVSYIAQAVMAILLGRPNDARARPSTLLKNDADYEKVFSASYPVNVYLNCARLMKKCEAFLRAKGIEPKEVNNLKYHLAMYAARLTANSDNLTPDRLAKLDLETLSDSFMDACVTAVNAVYIKLGATDQAAKGPKKMVERLSAQVQKGVFKKRLKNSEAS